MKRWIDSSLKNRLFLTISILCTVLLFLQGMTLSRTSSRALEDLVLREASTTLSLVRQNLGYSIQEMAYVPKDMETDPLFMQYLSAPRENHKDLTGMLMRYISRRTSLLSITLFPDEGGILSTTYTFDIKEEEIRNSSWYRRVRETGQPQLIYMDVRNFSRLTEFPRDGKTQYITLVHPLQAPDGSSRGIILISLDYFTVFNNIMEHLPHQEGRRILLFNNKGSLLFPVLAEVPEQLSREVTLRQGEGHMENSVGGEEFWYVYSASPDGIVLVEEIRRKELLAPVYANRRVFIVSLLGSIVAALLVSSFLSSRITRPIKRLEREMHQFEDKLFQLSVPAGRKDEVGELERSFNRMIRRMRDFQMRLMEKQEEKREAELKALQAQIKPHFLYNTLDSVKWMALIQGNDSIVEMVSSLTSLLRSSINQEDELIPLDREMENIERFMSIQNIRYSDRFTLIRDIPGEDGTVLIPKLLLQPLVENALMHAFGEEGGTVEVGTARDGEDLICRIRDNGKGFPREILEAWERKEDYPVRGSGVSLKNVRERLNLHFGESYNLKLENHPEGGGICTLRLPGERGES